MEDEGPIWRTKGHLVMKGLSKNVKNLDFEETHYSVRQKLETRGLFRSAICFRSILSRQNGLNRHMDQKTKKCRKSSFLESSSLESSSLETCAHSSGVWIGLVMYPNKRINQKAQKAQKGCGEILRIEREWSNPLSCRDYFLEKTNRRLSKPPRSGHRNLAEKTEKHKKQKIQKTDQKVVGN